MVATPVEPTPPVPEEEVDPFEVVEFTGPEPPVVLNCTVPTKVPVPSTGLPRTTAEKVPSLGK
jgi:hypothetical protein